MTAAPLSAVLITRNAAAVLDACLESLAFADEIVLVDSASSDGTVEIARNRGARVVQKEWLGFGRQKQFAVEQAKHDWVLCVDADERVSPELAKSIRTLRETDESELADGYRVARRAFYLGRWIRGGGWYPGLGIAAGVAAGAILGGVLAAPYGYGGYYPYGYGVTPGSSSR